MSWIEDICLTSMVALSVWRPMLRIWRINLRMLHSLWLYDIQSETKNSREPLRLKA